MLYQKFAPREEVFFLFPWVRADTGPTAASTIVSLAVMMLSGFLMTRLTKKLKLPNVTGYILAGILIGPFCLNTVPASFISHTDFLSDIALAFIAFSTGEFFRLSVLKKNGPRVIVITVLESLTASVLVFLAVWGVLGMDLSFSIVLAALAAATAPASTMMTIRQTHAKGDFVDTLLQVVAFDDIVGLVAFSAAIAVAVSAYQGTGFSLPTLIKPVLSNLGVLLLGGLFGLLLKLALKNRSSTDNRLIISLAMLLAFCGISTLFGLLLKLFNAKRHSTDNRLIIAVAVLFSYCGLCAAVDISPLLGCMAMATVYINLTEDERLFRQLGYFSPPILLLFFVRSGMSFDLGAVLGDAGTLGATPLLGVGVIYFFVRIIGKYAGAFIGCAITGKDAKVRNYLGLALVPQAGVAIGLAALGARTLGGDVGKALQTIILASSILYELVGPGLAKLSLWLSHSYSNKLEDLAPVPETDENGRVKTEAELLAERIQAIQKSLPPPTLPEENERVFTEEAEEAWRNTWNDVLTRNRERRSKGGPFR